VHLYPIGEIEPGRQSPFYGDPTKLLPLLCSGITDRGAAVFSLLDIVCTAYYAGQVIRRFRCSETEKVFRGGRSRKFGNLANMIERKLNLLDAANDLTDLRLLPGNRLEALKGDRAGQHSIRVNDRWRVCFVWKDGNAYDVEVVDYH
jgi:proteic killer suppression protein